MTMTGAAVANHTAVVEQKGAKMKELVVESVRKQWEKKRNRSEE